MKKLITIVMIICIMICGCNSTPKEPAPKVELPAEKPTPTEIPTIQEDETGIRYNVKELPFECAYNDTSFTIKDVKYLSCKNGKSNELIVLVILDVSNMPTWMGDKFDWFAEDMITKLDDDYLYDSKVLKELTSVYLTNEANNVKDKKLYLDCRLHYTDTNELYCFFSTVFLDDARYPYEDCSVKVIISTKQEEKAGMKYDKPIYKINRAIYTTDITKNDITPLSKESESVRDFIKKKIGSDWK